MLNVVIFLLYAALAYGLSRVWGIMGVVLGLAVAYSVLAILSLAAMRRETGRLDGRRLTSTLLKVLIAGAAMYAVATSERRSSGRARISRNAPHPRRRRRPLPRRLPRGGFFLGTEELRSVLTLLQRRSAG